MNKYFIIFAIIMINLNNEIYSQSETVSNEGFTLIKYFNPGLSEGERFMLESTIKECNRRIVNDETDYKAYFERGNAYSTLGIYVKAIKDYNEAITINPQFATAYYNRSLAKSRFGHNNDSCDDMYKASSLGLEEAVIACKEYCPN